MSVDGSTLTNCWVYRENFDGREMAKRGRKFTWVLKSFMKVI